MPKEWILNQANMRWGLTRKNKVGPVSELIRKCSPKLLGDWEGYYYKNVHPKEHLEELGKRLYIKITEVCQAEIESIREEDCISFIVNLVINRTYDGYQSEIQTIYGQLQQALGIKVEPAPDEWDRGYNVDFFIKIKSKYIGLQIKPAGHAYIPQIINELEFQRKTHEKFTAKYGGKVFYVISVKEGNNKIIHNPEIIEEIRKEIERLSLTQKTSEVEEIRQKHSKAYEKWTEEEDNILKKGYSQGKKIDEIAGVLKRQPGAIRSRLNKLGLGKNQ